MSELSIAIVTKGRPEILEDALRRLDGLLLIDNVILVDGSEDGETEEVCEKFGAEHYSQSKDGGRCAARNEALEKCDTEHIAFIDDDVLVSDDWFQEMKDTLEREDVVGATGKLEGEEVPLTGFARKLRDFLFGGREVFGEIRYNGVINGDFFYDEEKEVDHLAGCNMAFDVGALREAGGFNEDYDVGNAYREETEPSYQVGQKGKLVYNPEASVDHLEVEDIDEKVENFYIPYMTKYFLSRNDVVRGFRGRTGYLVNKLARHAYFSIKSLAGLNHYYLYYLYGEARSFVDFVLLDRKPREYV